MTGLVLLRTVFLIVVLVGLLLNGVEWLKAGDIRRKLRRARANGLKHQAAANLLSGARRRLLASLALFVLVGVLLNAPPVQPHPSAVRRAGIARLCFITIAVIITESGFAARRGRKKTEDLIDVELAKDEARGLGGVA